MAQAVNILISAQDNASATLKQVSAAIKSTGDTSEEANPKADRFGSTLGTLASRVRFVAETFAIYKVAQTVEQFAASSLGAAAQLEQTNMAFQALTGNVQVANKVFAELVQYANVTPFQSKDIVQAAQTLMGFGTVGQQTVDIIKQLGDVVSVGGGNLQQLSLVTGQVFAQGKLRAQDMYQVINDGGAGLIKIMAANVGGMQNLTAEFDKGGIPASQYFDAITQATNQGGFAFEGANKEAATFSGRLSTLKDAATQFGMALLGVRIDPALGYVVQPGGLFDRMRNGLLAVSTALQSWGPAVGQAMPAFLNGLSEIFTGLSNVAGVLGKVLGPSLIALWNTIATQLVPALMNLWQNVIVPILPVIGAALVGAIWLAVNALNALLQIVTPVMNFLGDHTFIVYGVATAFLALKAAMMLNTAFQALMTGFAIISDEVIPGVMAKITALRALTMSGMVMGSIAVAGALADIYLVTKAIQSVRDAINDMNAAAASARGATQAAASTHATLLQLEKTGTPDQKARSQYLIMQGYATGGYTGAGSSTDVAGVVHRGEYVIPKSGVDQRTGTPKASAGGNITIAGNVTIESPESADAFFGRMDSLQRLASRGMA